jgi:phytoene synthase
MYEIYAFCRRVDDIADSAGPRSDRQEQLEIWRRDIDAIYLGTPPQRLIGLEQAVRTFGLSREDFFAVIDGMEMDVMADLRAPDWNTLDLYCDRVASAVGRLSVRVFGLRQDDGIALAHHLGRALQLTNILRDLDEDAAVGRLYLPREALQDAGITAVEPAAVLASPELTEACVPVAKRALFHFAEADKIMAYCSRRLVRAPRIMGRVYRAILDGLIERGFAPPRRPVRVGRARLLWIVLRNAVI